MSSEQNHLKETDTEAHFDFKQEQRAAVKSEKGLTEEIIRMISEDKDEPDWMLERRLKGLKLFDKKPMPAWGAELDDIDFDNIKYFVRSTEKQATSWEELPEDIKNTYDKLGIPLEYFVLDTVKVGKVVNVGFLGTDTTTDLAVIKLDNPL